MTSLETAPCPVVRQVTDFTIGSKAQYLPLSRCTLIDFYVFVMCHCSIYTYPVGVCLTMNILVLSFSEYKFPLSMYSTLFEVVRVDYRSDFRLFFEEVICGSDTRIDRDDAFCHTRDDIVFSRFELLRRSHWSRLHVLRYRQQPMGCRPPVLH